MELLSFSKVPFSKLIFLIPLFSFATFLEIFSLSLLVPVIQLLLGQDFESNILNSFSNYFINSETFIFISIILIFIFSALVRLFALKCQISIVFHIVSKLRTNILNSFQKISYHSYISMDHENFISSISVKIGMIAHGVLLPIVSLFSNGLTIFSAIVFVYYLMGINGLFFICVLALIFYATYTFSKSKLISNSNIINSNTNSRINVLLSLVNFQRELRIFNLSDNLIKKYGFIENELKEAETQNQYLSLFPKITIETVIYIIIIAFTYAYNTANNIELSVVLPNILVTAIAIQKILPLIQQVYFAFSSISSSYYVVNDVVNLIQNIHNQIPNKPKITHNSSNLTILSDFEIIVKNASIIYKSPPAQINLPYIKISSGSFYLLKGESGAGKSSLLDLLAGLMPLHSGSITINDSYVNLDELDIWQSNISYASQNPVLISGTIRSNIILDSDFNQAKFNQSIEISGLTSLLNKFTEREFRAVGPNSTSFSGGEKQRIALARALYKDSSIILLDEPTSGLNKELESEFLQKLKYLKGSKTVIISSHTIKLSEIFDDVITL